MNNKVVSLIPAVAILLATCHLQAFQDAGGEEAAAASDGCGTVTCTVMVPERVMETRYRCVTKYRQEDRTRTYNVVRCIPETKEVEESYTVMVPEQRTRTVKYTVRKPVTEEYEVKYTVRKPVTEAYEVKYKVVS